PPSWSGSAVRPGQRGWSTGPPRHDAGGPDVPWHWSPPPQRPSACSPARSSPGSWRRTRVSRRYPSSRLSGSRCAPRTAASSATWTGAGPATAGRWSSTSPTDRTTRATCAGWSPSAARWRSWATGRSRPTAATAGSSRSPGAGRAWWSSSVPTTGSGRAPSCPEPRSVLPAGLGPVLRLRGPAPGADRLPDHGQLLGGDEEAGEVGVEDQSVDPRGPVGLGPFDDLVRGQCDGARVLAGADQLLQHRDAVGPLRLSEGEEHQPAVDLGGGRGLRPLVADGDEPPVRQGHRGAPQGGDPHLVLGAGHLGGEPVDVRLGVGQLGGGRRVVAAVPRGGVGPLARVRLGHRIVVRG